MLISNKMDFRTMNIIRDKDVYFIMQRGKFNESKS